MTQIPFIRRLKNKNGRSKIIIVDFNAVVVSNICMYARQNNNRIDIHDVRAMVLTSLKRYRRKFFRSHGELVICVDGKKVWRKDEFPYYKENRKAKKEKDPLDWTLIGNVIYTIAKELYTHFPYKVISVTRTEADDAIAVITKEMSKQEAIIIISGDKDLVQLQRYPNVKNYDPVRDRYLGTDDPARFLKEHVLRGDSSDGVPNFMSDDDTFMNSGKRQKSIFDAKLTGWLDDPEFFNKSEFKDNIERNQKLIDLTNIPEELQIKIKKQFARDPVGHRTMLMKYFAAKHLNNFIESIGEF